MKVFFSIFLCFVLSYNTQAQLANGTTAPNWTMSDLNGNSHTLYDYLNNGKAVVLDFSAAYCSTCWGYHNSHALENFYNSRGPNATNYQANVFFIEPIANNTTGCLHGPSGGGMPFQACSGGSAGNWIAGTPYPIIDNSSQNGAYSVNYYPMVYMVCPNKTTHLVGTQTAAQLDNSMQTLCGITPGGATASPLSYQYSNVTNNPCFGDKKGSITIIPNGGTAPYSYQWSNGASSATINNLSAGAYKATITDSQNKTLITNQLTIAEGSQIAAALTVNKYEKCGNAGSINLNASGGSGTFSYQWSNNATTKNLTNLTNTATYSLTVTDALGCKLVKNAIAIDGFDNQPTTNISNTLTLNCDVKSAALNGTVSPASNNYTYGWTSSNGTILSQTNNSANVNASGIYTYKVSDNLSKCFATATTTVVENLTKPTISFSANADKILHCNKKEITISPMISDAGNAPTYNWTSANGGVFVGTQTTAMAKINNAGIFQLEVKNNVSACKSVNSITILQAAKPVLGLFQTGDIKCFGDKNATLTSNTGATQTPISYLWSNNATTANLEKQAAGNYALTVTDAYGCTIAATLIVTQPQPLILKVAQITKATGTSSNGSIDMAIAGGIKPYTFSWKKDGVKLSNNSEDLTNISSGTYEVVVTDVNNCNISSEKIILQSTTTAVEDINGLITYKFYPNPTNNILNVFLQTSENQLIIAQLVDVYGKVIERKPVSLTAIFQEQFDLISLPNAVYFLHLQVGEKKIVEKILKN
jgi:VCBS repeat-containing protein